MELTHRDVCTHFDNIEDRDVLTRRSFDVNMRLLKTSPSYRQIIEDICKYIAWSATTEKPGYSKPKGWSGPNAGIPFRIIYVPPYGIMLNPEWISNIDNKDIEDVMSNCGSLTLPRQKRVMRVKGINVRYCTLDGEVHGLVLTRENGGYTFQHEFNHCEGELI